MGVDVDLQPIENPAGMVKVNSLGVVRGASLFLTEKLPHVELTWKKFVEAPQATVPARKCKLCAEVALIET